MRAVRCYLKCPICYTELHRIGDILRCRKCMRLFKQVHEGSPNVIEVKDES